mmetsp:Transcript_14339/g.50311  ORF Transcript_14339/g.50311 Transcript_14339/m.50311 type:complete len:218 (+) Transcript_14339:485-1138(+)
MQNSYDGVGQARTAAENCLQAFWGNEICAGPDMHNARCGVKPAIKATNSNRPREALRARKKKRRYELPATSNSSVSLEQREDARHRCAAMASRVRAKCFAKAHSTTRPGEGPAEAKWPRSFCSSGVSSSGGAAVRSATSRIKNMSSQAMSRSQSRSSCASNDSPQASTKPTRNSAASIQPRARAWCRSFLRSATSETVRVASWSCRSWERQIGSLGP